MEEKKLISESPAARSRKLRFVKLLRNKNFIISILAVFSLIVLEFSTDFVEVIIGSIIDLTNPLRPKSGTVWELHEKDQIATEQLQQIRQAIPGQPEELADIHDLSQLQKILDERQTVMLGAEQFQHLYNLFPPSFAYQVIPPFDLLKLAHSRKWIWTRITKGTNSLAIHFLDGEKQFLMDTYPPLTVLYELPDSKNIKVLALDSIDVFKGRTITRDQFFAAFDDLSSSMKLRLINNPFQLVKWDKKIQQVAISRFAIGNIVTIGFQIDQGIYTEIYSFEASDLAVENLIERLNQLYPALNFAFPEEKYSEFPNHF